MVNDLNSYSNFELLNISIVQESSDSDLEIEGTPDFFVYQNSSDLFKTLVGFIECKKINYELITNQLFKYSIRYSNSNFIFLVKKPSKSLRLIGIRLHFLKIFILKNVLLL